MLGIGKAIAGLAKGAIGKAAKGAASKGAKGAKGKKGAEKKKPTKEDAKKGIDQKLSNIGELMKQVKGLLTQLGIGQGGPANAINAIRNITG